MTWLHWLAAGCVALSAGSFINVVVYRLPLQLSQDDSAPTLWQPNSHCPGCQTPLRWRDNIPLISWFMSDGRCRTCLIRISWRYPLVEAVTFVLSLLLVWCLPFDTRLIAALLLLWVLLALIFIDFEHFLLPDALTLPLLWIGLLLKSAVWIPGSLNEAVTGAAAGYLFLWLLGGIYHRMRGITALGMGDAKLVAAMGAWLGYPLLPWVLLIASSGAILYVVIAKILWQRSCHLPLAFGPWIAVAGISLFINTII